MDVKPIIIDVDFKRNTMIKEHKVRHGDNVPLMLRVFDDGEAFDLSTMETISLVITRLDRQTIVLLGKVFENQATFNLGGKELAVSGSVQATAQFYSVDGRVSTFNFKLIAESDPITNYIPQKEEETLIVKVLKNGPAVIEAAQTATAGALQAEEIALNAAEETNKSRENLTDSVIGALDTLEQDKAQALLEMAEERTLTNQVKEDTIAVKEEVMGLAKTVGENGVYAREQAERAKAEADRLEGTDVSVLDNKITTINNNLTTQLADKATIKIFNKMPTSSELSIGEFGFVINPLRLIDVDFSTPNHLTDYFGTSKAGNTSIVVQNGTLNIEGEAANSDAGIVFLKDTIPTDQRRKFTHKAKTLSASPSAYMLNLELFTAEPAVAVSSTIPARTIFKVFQRSTGGISIYRKLANGANEYWDGTTNLWVTANSTISCPGNLNTFYNYELETNGSQVRINVLNADGNSLLVRTPYMDWSLLVPTGVLGKLRLYWGDINTDAHFANINSDSFTII